MQKVAKEHNEGSMTKKGWIGWAKSLLRAGSVRWRPKNACKKEARYSRRRVNPKTGRMCYFGLCAMCRGLYPEKEMQADHVNPVVPVGKNMFFCHMEGFDPEKHVCLAEVYERMYVERDGYQMLCKDCHKQKSKKENEDRVQFQRNLLL